MSLAKIKKEALKNIFETWIQKCLSISIEKKINPFQCVESELFKCHETSSRLHLIATNPNFNSDKNILSIFSKDITYSPKIFNCFSHIAKIYSALGNTFAWHILHIPKLNIWVSWLRWECKNNVKSWRSHSRRRRRCRRCGRLSVFKTKGNRIFSFENVEHYSG